MSTTALFQARKHNRDEWETLKISDLLHVNVVKRIYEKDMDC